ncbi:hypothetical protein ABZ860_12315, partial [Microbispora sp. NPDC046973]|uniref:hypothetical protein n=1 Tax=Microbispora sp. NPDC046973 TaxID=3155022 RepID=UPI0033DF2E09
MSAIKLVRDTPNGAEAETVIGPRNGTVPTRVMVKYEDTGNPWHIWEQLIPQHASWSEAFQWHKVDLRDRMSKANIRLGTGVDPSVAPGDGLDFVDRAGYFDAPPLQVGNIYRVWGTQDPESPPPAPLGEPEGTIMAVATLRNRGKLFRGDGGAIPTPFGTYVDVRLDGVIDSVVVIAEIGEGQPATHPDGYPYFRRPIGRGLTTALHTGTWHLSLTSSGEAWLDGRALRPGATYTGLVRVLNTHGDWDYRTGTVTLLQRQVDVTVESVTIINDGDPGGASDGWFAAGVYLGQWGSQEFQMIRRWQFPPGGLAELDDGDVFGIGGTVHQVGPPWEFSTGPRAVEPGRRAFGVRVEVFDKDGIFEPDETASGVWELEYADAPLFQETVDGRFSATTDDNTPGYVKARASGRYSISHRPPQLPPPTGPWQSVELSAGELTSIAGNRIELGSSAWGIPERRAEAFAHYDEALAILRTLVAADPAKYGPA